MKDRTLFNHPFSARYWLLAFREFTSLRMLLIAALLTACRIAVKALSIPIMPGLSVNFGFIFNAAGSMIYGPVVAVAASAVSDTLGAILFPKGAYFFPYIFAEIAGGVVFALFYYRSHMETLRVILGYFSVMIIVNFILNPVIGYLSYLIHNPEQKEAYQFLALPKIITNLVLFPLKSFVLVLLFRLLLPITNRFELTFTGTTNLKLTWKEVLWIIGLTVVSALALFGYYLYKTADKKL